MKKHIVILLILAAALAAFISCDADSAAKTVYHTVTIDYVIDWLPLYRTVVKDGDTIEAPKTPEKNGYIFFGWKTENGEDFDFTSPVKADVTIKAEWKAPDCNITLKDKSGNVIRTAKVVYGTSYTLPTDLGYTINSCTDGNGKTYTTASVVITDTNTVLTIKELTYNEYNIGDIGPAGGYIVFDADATDDSTMHGYSEYSSETLGWRYLECSKEDLEATYSFGYYRPTGTNTTLIAETDGQKIGKGKTNTASLIEAMGETAYDTETSENKAEYAAFAAASYDGGGYSDWFLPSSEELSKLASIVNLNIGDVSKNTKYWSSTEFGNDGLKADCSDFDSHYIGGFGVVRSEKHLVRPFRSF